MATIINTNATPLTLDAATDIVANLTEPTDVGFEGDDWVYLVVDQGTVKGDGYEFTGGTPAAKFAADYGDAVGVKVYDGEMTFQGYL